MQLSDLHSVSSCCSVLGVSRSAYYAYRNGKTYSLSTAKQAISDEIHRLFWYHKRRYGTRRIRVDLLEAGHFVGRYQIAQRMREQGLVAIQPKRFVPKTTQSHPQLQRAPNLLLLAENQPSSPSQVIVGDITYLPNQEAGYGKWLYLATWLDLFSHRIVGWHIDRHMQDSLVITALQKMIELRQPAAGLICHSDGGGQYQSDDYKTLLLNHNFRQSMTRKDNHYDNAHAESLFSRFKAELLDGGTFYGLEDALNRSFEFIEYYYNGIRRHSSIGYKSPVEFEKNFYLKSTE